MHLDATFYAFVALVIFLGILGKLGIHKQILGTLDSRAADIAKELAERFFDGCRLLGHYRDTLVIV